LSNPTPPNLENISRAVGLGSGRLRAERGTHAQVGCSEVLSALSYALDMTEGQPPGHSMRTCLIGMRIADAIGLSADERSALYYALLLKDAGCSSNSARFAAVFGADDQAVKPRMKIVDWHKRVRLALVTLRTAGLGGSLFDHVKYFIAIARSGDFTREIIKMRCERGADIARQLGFPEATAQGIKSLDEHWCGLGYPEGLSGERIPLLSRIANLSQAVDMFHNAHGPDAALRVAKERSGSWFDPRLTRVVLSWRDDRQFWQSLRSDNVAALVEEAEPADRTRVLDDAGIDTVAQAFADIVDAKSPYTSEHSRRVGGVAVTIAAALGETIEEQRRIFRAALLHDIGKLGVSSRILEKPGPLTPAEMATIQKHPMATLSILSRVRVFGDFAWTASLHHEKLDGSGYPWGLAGKHLDQAARILVVADMYDALTSDRPYRPGLTHDGAMGILRGDARVRICERSVDTLSSRA
jgi:HD-GYP domain-containing protein (c-di-GMP phosphodiesterase class II)